MPRDYARPQPRSKPLLRTGYQPVRISTVGAAAVQSGRWDPVDEPAADARLQMRSSYVANMPQLCVAAYGCLDGMWLPTSGHCCLSSITYIGDSRYLDMISNNAVIINANLCSHSEQ
jgi:hypothetical protein